MPRVYAPGDLYEPGEFAAALAIGDSWFWYPNNNILGTLVHHPDIRPEHSFIQNLGFNGAELQDYVGAGRHAKAVQHYLSPNFRHGFGEFYISGAGNDAVDYGLALSEDCSGISDPKACLDEARLDTLLRKISTALGGLIHDIRWAYRNDAAAKQPIFFHGYDYPVPDGRGFAGRTAWLKPAMDASRVDPDLKFRVAVARALIDRLNEEVFMQFHSPQNQVVHIDSRGTLSASGATYKKDWTNEMHPTNSGFAEIVEQHWIPELAKFGIAR